jgi:hypothetical protein
MLCLYTEDTMHRSCEALPFVLIQPSVSFARSRHRQRTSGIVVPGCAFPVADDAQPRGNFLLLFFDFSVQRNNGSNFRFILGIHNEHRELNMADDRQRGRTFAVPAFHLMKIRLRNTAGDTNVSLCFCFSLHEGQVASDYQNHPPRRTTSGASCCGEACQCR